MSLPAISCGGGAGDAEAARPVEGPAPGGGAVPADEPMARSWDELTPENQAATFRNADRLSPSRVVARGGPVQPLPAHARSLEALRYEHDGRSSSIDQYMARRRTAGLLLLKSGAVALERYGMGNVPASRWTSFSVAKSFTSTLAGAALHAGALDTLDRRVESLVPRLGGTAWAGSTLRQLLRMSSGIRWNEDYADPASDIGLMSAAILSNRPGAVMEMIRTRTRAAAPGVSWNYSTGESYVLGAAIAAATGTTLSDWHARAIWSVAGMEADGYWLLDAPGGQELSGSNFSATLRDYGRLGLVVLRDGVIGSRRVLPAGWGSLAGRPDTPLTAPGSLTDGRSLGYGYHWWSMPGRPAFTGQGLFGQFLYIDPSADFVAVVWSAWPVPWDAEAERETYALLTAAVQALG